MKQPQCRGKTNIMREGGYTLEANANVKAVREVPARAMRIAHRARTGGKPRFNVPTADGNCL